MAAHILLSFINALDDRKNSLYESNFTTKFINDFSAFYLNYRHIEATTSQQLVN
jgi:hypothetical protein